MRQELWSAILGARADLDRLIAAAVGDYPDQAPPRAVATRPAPPRIPPGPQLVWAAGERAAAVPRMAAAQDTARLWVDPARPAAAPAPGVEHEAVQRLHQDVSTRLEILRAALVTEPGGEQAMLALVLYFDEHIMTRLPSFLATSWPLLQTRLTHRNTGGADFFRFLDRLLETEPSLELVFEVYYFCLASGFQGQYADDLVALERYQQRLRARIAAPAPARQPREPVLASSPAPIRWKALYYAIAVGVVIVVGAALTVWSNR